MYNIKIEDLAPNALIKAVQMGKNFLTFREVEEYGARVVANLNKKSEGAVLLLSRDRTEEFWEEYAAFFQKKCVDGEQGIEVKEGITVEDLIERFRGYLALDVLMAFVDEYAVEALSV